MARLDTDLIIGGIKFLVVGHAQARMVRTIGVYALARRWPNGRRTLLHVDWAQEQGRAARSSPEWREALALGMNELLFTVGVSDPEALETLKARLIATARPPLNLDADLGKLAA